jgi:phospholipid/cholesterol/gamma-HCH transport system ATP-binding protein
MIEVRNISKSFKGKQVLNDISMIFMPGQTNLIIGGSGSGKTVLMKCMVGLFEIDNGQILYNNRNFSNLNFKERKEIRKEIGMVFQGGALFDSSTVEENVMFPLMMFTTMTRKERTDRANFCLDRVNLQNANKFFPSEISGGMKKRVAIARAIAMNPKYLFFDEPNSGLDPKTSIVIDQLIQEITKEYNITTVINTHDMNSVMEIGDKVVFIYNGIKEWEGSSKDILSTTQEEVVSFVFASNLMKRLKDQH